jgi:putative transposase
MGPGRPRVLSEVRELIRKISLANPRWGAPRIHGELLKLGIEVSQATVAKYMVRCRKPPSQTWRSFLKNHAMDLLSADFFGSNCHFPVAHRLCTHFPCSPTPCPLRRYKSDRGMAQQLLDAFPWDSAPRYLLHDRDGSYGEKFHEAAARMGIREVLTAPQSPWQNAYVERLISSIRRECLDHVIVLHESGLRRLLKSYFAYYERSRTHLALATDAPIPWALQRPELGPLIQLPQVGGLHHRYERRAA